MEKSDASLEASRPGNSAVLFSSLHLDFCNLRTFDRMRIIGSVGPSRNLQDWHFDHGFSTSMSLCLRSKAQSSSLPSSNRPPLPRSRKGERPAIEDSFRIISNQFERQICTKTPTNGVASFRQYRLAIFIVMSIGREHMHGIILQQPHCNATSDISPQAGNGGSGDLHQTSCLYPLQNTFGPLLQNSIAFRVGDDWNDTGRLQSPKTVAYLGRYPVFAKLD